MLISRRSLIAAGAAGAVSMGFASRIAFAAAATDRRFVFIIQRGAADGLHTLAPVGDPAYASLRGPLAQDFAGAPKLDGMFALHPALTNIGALYQSGEALFVHAVASPYRDRSHFDGQNVLETGGTAAYARKDGWLNRMLTVLPGSEAKAIALSPSVPMALRGIVEVQSYAPSALPDANEDLLGRVSGLYAGDAQLHATWEQAMATRKLTADIASVQGQNGAATGQLAAKLLAPADGARVAMIETTGWDTHAQQRGRLNAQFRGLDALIGALKTGMGPAWSQTVVLIATEFGRTAAVNGTQGTDHGTASVAMLIGGAVKGGRVLADWPGLGTAQLYEGRDLKPTLGLDTLIASAAAAHFAVEPKRLSAATFPDLPASPAIQDLIRA